MILFNNINDLLIAQHLPGLSILTYIDPLAFKEYRIDSYQNDRPDTVIAIKDKTIVIPDNLTTTERAESIAAALGYIAQKKQLGSKPVSCQTFVVEDERLIAQHTKPQSYSCSL
jgi:hypothetical protein